MTRRYRTFERRKRICRISRNHWRRVPDLLVTTLNVREIIRSDGRIRGHSVLLTDLGNPFRLRSKNKIKSTDLATSTRTKDTFGTVLRADLTKRLINSREFLADKRVAAVPLTHATYSPDLEPSFSKIKIDLDEQRDPMTVTQQSWRTP